MNGVRQQFLAGAALAGQEHAGIGARHHVGLGELVLHQLVAGHDVGAPILIYMGEAGDLQRLLNVIEKVLLVDRLGQKSEGATLRRVDGVGNGAVRRQDDDAQARPAALQFLEQPDPVHLIHAQVGDDQVGPEAGTGREGGRGALDRLDLVILGAQSDGEQAQQPRIIVDDENSRLAFLRRGLAGAGLQAKGQRRGGGDRKGVHFITPKEGSRMRSIRAPIVDRTLDVGHSLQLCLCLFQGFP